MTPARSRLATLVAATLASCASAESDPDAGPSGAGADSGIESVDASIVDAGNIDAPLVFTSNAGDPLPVSRSAAGITVGTPNVLYVEAWEGGFTGCPEQSSPTPDRTFIVSGVVLDGRTEQDQGLSATLLDFEGNILPSGTPFSRATLVRVTNIDDDLCAPDSDCDDADRIGFDVEAVFSEGTLSGRVDARHCGSLDE